MLVVTLTWTEPDDGTHVIVFPDDAVADVASLDGWLQARWPDEYGHTVARIGWEKREGAAADEDPWGDLALNVRYTTGEGLYGEDCPAFKERGIARS